MTDRDYYSSSHAPANPYYDGAYDHQAGLYTTPTPTKAPRDYNRPYYPQQHSHSALSGRSDDIDQYDERDAIPLDGRRKHESTTSVAPILQPADDDPFVRDTKPSRRKSRRQAQEDGWFKGKITWACYVLTLAQLIVFIAELVKNGRSSLSDSRHPH